MVSLMRQHLVKCHEKKMMHPFSKQDSTKRVLNAKNSAITQYSLFMSFSMPICKRGSSDWVYELLWVVPPEVRKNTSQNVYKQSSQFLLQRMLLKILPVIVSDLLQHLQAEWNVNFYPFLAKYITNFSRFYFCFRLLISKSIFCWRLEF